MTPDQGTIHVQRMMLASTLGRMLDRAEGDARWLREKSAELPTPFPGDYEAVVRYAVETGLARASASGVLSGLKALVALHGSTDEVNAVIARAAALKVEAL